MQSDGLDETSKSATKAVDQPHPHGDRASCHARYTQRVKFSLVEDHHCLITEDVQCGAVGARKVQNRGLEDKELGTKSPDVPSNRGARGLLSYWDESKLSFDSSFHYMTRERLETFSFFLHSFLSFSSRESGYRCSVFVGTEAWHIEFRI